MSQGRSMLFLTFLVCLGGCIPRQRMDLRQPIYLVTDPSFFSGCKSDRKGPAICKEWRLYQVKLGINDWLKHFDEPMRPQTIIVYSHDDVPESAENPVIHLRVRKGYCDEGTPPQVAACFHYIYRGEALFVFEAGNEIDAQTVAHEFGHALGREHEDTSEDIGSVMSSSRRTRVLPIDITLVCQLHEECPAYEDTWCEASFYDESRCPSASYEEGEVLREAREEENY